MAHLLIVGDKNCSFNSLAIAIGDCPTHAKVLDNWKELAKHLNTNEIKKFELQQSLNLGTTKISCIPQELMTEWRSRNAKAATLKKFCEALDASGLNSTAEYLIENFVPKKKTDSEKPRNIEPPKEKAGSVNKMESDGQQEGLEYVSLEIGYTDTYDIWPGENISEMMKPQIPMDFPDDGYHLPKDTSKGAAIVINVIKYEPHTNFKNREKGSAQDAAHLDAVLDELGYQDVEIHNSPVEIYTRSLIQTLLLNFRRKCIKHDVCSLLVFVGCHGMNGALEMSDGSTLDIYKDVVYLFNTKNASKLEKIPKMFIFQACKEIKNQRPLAEFPEKDGAEVSSPMDNTMVCFSTIPGYFAMRYQLIGSAYVYSLTRILRKYAHEMDFEKMLKLISQDTWKIVERTCRNQISYGVSVDEVETLKQLPMHHTIGSFKKLYFNMNTL